MPIMYAVSPLSLAECFLTILRLSLIVRLTETEYCRQQQVNPVSFLQTGIRSCCKYNCHNRKDDERISSKRILKAIHDHAPDWQENEHKDKQ